MTVVTMLRSKVSLPRMGLAAVKHRTKCIGRVEERFDRYPGYPIWPRKKCLSNNAYPDKITLGAAYT